MNRALGVVEAMEALPDDDASRVQGGGSGTVAYVITQPCIGTRDATCVEVCPVDCIRSGDDSEMNFIDPSGCIDCGACVDTCPVSAIYPEDQVPAQWRSFFQINADYFRG
jgi:NAD-dependent dihydropyrimidine dehydrogenase PreA subunit